MDFPQTAQEFHKRFSDEVACRQYLAALRWPEGFQCPGCKGGDFWTTARGLYHCRSCDHQASITAGTLFMDTHLALRVWFEAMWQITSQKYGASALGLQRVLGLGSYRTAWNLLHKLRRAMVRPGRDQLKGVVELDDIYIGGHRPRSQGRALKRWLLGTHQGSVARTHLDYYLDEFYVPL